MWYGPFYTEDFYERVTNENVSNGPTSSFSETTATHSWKIKKYQQREKEV